MELMLSLTYFLSASWFVVEASLGIFQFMVAISDAFVLILLSIETILSLTAFFDGAIHVTPSQVVASYAVFETAPAVAALTWSSTYFFTVWLDGYFVVLSVGTSPVSLFVLSSTVHFAIPLSARSPADVRLARLSAVAEATLFAFL